MFSLAEIAKLQAAGYTLDDILAANAAEAQAQPADPAPAQPADPAPAQPADPTPDQPADPMSAMMGKLDELITTIRAGNVRGANFPAPASPEDTAQQVLASIINPPAKTGKK